MSRRGQLRRSEVFRAAAAAVAPVLVVAVTAGCGSADGSVDASAGLAGPTATATVSVPQGVRDFRSTQRLPPVPAPQRVRIPRLGVDSALELLDRRADKTVEVPKDWQRAGWYRDGPSPGEPGSAVILGHVDSPQGPAVFSGLAGVPAGTRVIVDRADGSSVTFRVTRVEQFLRARFPIAKVYLPTLARELRLITCGGRYDRSRGGYQSNVVVFATAERGSAGG